MKIARDTGENGDGLQESDSISAKYECIVAPVLLFKTVPGMLLTTGVHYFPRTGARPTQSDKNRYRRAATGAWGESNRDPDTVN
jgi:hypothetical protein